MVAGPVTMGVGTEAAGDWPGIYQASCSLRASPCSLSRGLWASSQHGHLKAEKRLLT